MPVFLKGNVVTSISVSSGLWRGRHETLGRCVRNLQVPKQLIPELSEGDLRNNLELLQRKGAIDARREENFLEQMVGRLLNQGRFFVERVPEQKIEEGLRTLVEKGGSAFTAWREKNKDLPSMSLSGLLFLERKDFRGIDLSGMNLEGAHLPHAYLQDARLRNSNLRGASLVEAALTGADLEFATMWGADFSGTDLSYAHLSASVVSEGVNLTGTILKETRVIGVESTPDRNFLSYIVLPNGAHEMVKRKWWLSQGAILE